MVIYIHIPFCKKKCDYCDFLSAPADDEAIESYVSAQIKEISYYGDKYGKSGENRSVETVFFGGGTPSILSGNQIEAIMNKLKDDFNIEETAEITMECNPGTADKNKLVAMKNSGINRLSIGLQTANDNELKAVGRIHTYEEFLNIFKMARECGFENINVDLMSALPHQTLDSYKESLRKIVNLRPEHISAYSLILEEGTPLFDRIEALNKAHQPNGLPDEDEERAMYYLTKEFLGDNGYERYEISNYALKNYECRHNIAYWIRKDYIGMGLGAASCIDNVRMKNISSLNEYLQLNEGDNYLDSSETEVLSEEEKMAEFMFLGLRLTKGISTRKFEEQFGVAYDTIYGSITQKHINDGLLEKNGENIRLTELGMDVCNVVMSSYILC